MKKYLLLSLLVVGCSAGHFDKQTSFQHANFASETDCKAAQAKEFVNCYQNLTFYPTGEVYLIVTDIGNMGKYDIDGSDIHLNFFESVDGEFGKEFVFKKASDQLLKDPYGRDWVRR